MVRDTQAGLLRDLRARFPKAQLIHDKKACGPVVKRVSGYIAAPLRRFGLPLDIRGTELQKRVWDEVRKIPFGATSSYSKIAAAIGAPKAIRAVASACSRSWFAFAIPCHRVLHTGATQGRHREGRQYEWVHYEALELMKRKKSKRHVPQVSDSKLTPHPEPADPKHEEWLIDEAADESFPASDPSAVAQPHRRPRNKKTP